MMGSLLQSFFDGFGPAGMFVRMDWPDAPSQLFADSNSFGTQQREIVQDLFEAAKTGRIVSARRDARAGRVESTVVYYDTADLHDAGHVHRA